MLVVAFIYPGPSLLNQFFCDSAIIDKTLFYKRYSIHHRGTITDITKTVRQVKKILNLIVGKFSEPTGTLIEDGFFGQNTRSEP